MAKRLQIEIYEQDNLVQIFKILSAAAGNMRYVSPPGRAPCLAGKFLEPYFDDERAGRSLIHVHGVSVPRVGQGVNHFSYSAQRSRRAYAKAYDGAYVEP